jgi:hypothetical protein
MLKKTMIALGCIAVLALVTAVLVPGLLVSG